MKTSVEARAALDALPWEQRELAVLLAGGMGTKEIAYRRKLAEGTIKFHRNTLYRTLGVKKAIQLGVIVGMAGLVTDWRAPS